MTKALFIFVLFLSITTNAQERVTFLDALIHIGISETQTKKVEEIQSQKRISFKKLRQSDLNEEEKQKEKRNINKRTKKKILDVVKEETFSAAKKYYKDHKK